MLEREYKRLLTPDEHRLLLRCLSLPTFAAQERLLQVNYYYDMPDGSLNRRGVTVRIRQAGDRLQGTVKRHRYADGVMHSLEEDFPVTRLPVRLSCGGQLLVLRGQLVTERRRVRLDRGVELMLDENFYLGRRDFELELEFTEPKRARSWMRGLDALLGGAGQATPLSKSQRVFAALRDGGSGDPYPCRTAGKESGDDAVFPIE